MDINTLNQLLGLISLHKAKMTMAYLTGKGEILVTIVAYDRIDQFNMNSHFLRQPPDHQVKLLKDIFEKLKEGK